MANYTIIDRRLNPGGKNLGNRQRFLKRAKEQLQKSVKEGLLDRSITSGDDQNVNIPDEGIREPSFHHNHETGSQDYVLPGNKEYVPGDIIEKPKGGGGGGAGEASDSGEGEDDFQFAISKDEYQAILFEGLELPDLKKKTMKETVTYTKVRAGHVSEGTPCNLDLTRSMRNSLGRRIALKKPKLKRIKEIEEELESLNNQRSKGDLVRTTITALEAELKKLKRKAKGVSFLDPIDLKYRNYEKKPVPKHKAVMFCVMDVSASMGDHEKDLAKRFYMLLYMFLNYKYDTVDVVFIRHHTRASECTEEEFFYSKETGGTVVSSGFEEMMRIQRERYPVEDWNIYCAQASDGDNYGSDNPKLTHIMTSEVLPIVQYFAYIEVSGMSDNRSTFYLGRESEYGLWPVYRGLSEDADHMVMTRVQDPKHVYAVFRELFAKDKESR